MLGALKMSENAINFDSVYDKNEHNFKKICLQLCKKYLFKHWIQLNEDDFIFHRIDGGFINQTYYCSLPESMIRNDKEVTEFIIRFYGEFNCKFKFKKFCQF